MKSIVAEAEIRSPDGGECWRQVYDYAIESLGEYFIESRQLDPINGRNSNAHHGEVCDYYSATHEFTFPVGGLISVILEYTYTDLRGMGRYIIFALHDNSPEEDAYVDDTIAEAMDSIRQRVNEAAFQS